MLFNSIDFLIFFPLVTLAYFLLPKRARWVWLLVASYFFYMCWNAKYALLIAASTLITYLSGLLLQRAGKIPEERRRNRRKKLWVALSFLLNLGILFFFKYFDFFLGNLSVLLALVGVALRQPSFNIVLPVGISFYTFQALSYTMDVYRGETAPERNFFRYALFVSFFPQLVAGPIERSKNMLSQLHREHSFDPRLAREGLLLMLWGMFEKIVVADRLSYLVTEVYDNYASIPGSAIVLATALFAVQIYCDFAGYSHIAMGAARVLGIQLTENFRQPYLARSTADFWRRWHISLTTWFRDYLYIPLGGSRKGTARRYLNVMIVFLASGLWHGASWSFVAWGGLNGLYQILGSLLAPARERLCRALRLRREHPVWTLPRMIWTFLLIDFSWLFFRADSFSTAISMLRHMFSRPFLLSGWDALFSLGLGRADFAVALAAIAVLILADVHRERRGSPLSRLTARPLPVRWAVYLAGLFAVLIFGIYGPGYSETQFIYFQF
ncbi:MAG: MBOAT family protein [Oscillospiraceae bacterium]|nr:MBOAT family protein [Oscillospiraceae bacterium]